MTRRSIKQQLEETKNTPQLYLSTGSTMLNLAMTGSARKGFRTGHYYLFVGDSRSGKTWFCLSCLAEASIDKRFNDYRFIYDNRERGALMDIAYFFGRKAAERIESPTLKTK